MLPSLIAIALFIGFLFLILKPQFEEAIVSKKREMIKELVNSATSILQKYYNDEKEGILTREEAQKTAISRIQYLRYGRDNKDYFWITDLRPFMIMHPYVTELNGQDLNNYTDPTGKKLFVESVRLVQQKGEGYIEYMWQFKDDSSHILPKLSYVKIFKPWNWIIGTGVYIDDVKNEINQLTSRLIKTSLLITLVILVILSFISYQSYNIEKKRQIAENNLIISNEKYRSLVEASTEALVMTKNLNILYANEWFYKIIGTNNFSKSTIENYIILPENIKQQIEQQISIIKPFETTILSNKNEKTTEVLVSISLVNFLNEPVYIFTIRDISTFKETKRNLEEIAERFKYFLDIANIGYIKTTFNYKGTIIDANNKALQILEVENLSQLKDKAIINFLTNDNEKRILINQLLKNKSFAQRTFTIKLLNGEKKEIRLSLKIIHDEFNKPSFCEGIIENVNKEHPVFEQTISSYKHEIENIITLVKKEIKDDCLPIQIIHQNASFINILKAISNYENKYLIVQNDDNQILGYITPLEIITAFTNYTNPYELRSYQIMKSPIPNVNINSTYYQTYSIAKLTNSNLILVSDKEKYLGVLLFNENNYLLNSEIFYSLNKFKQAFSVEQLKILKKEFDSKIVTLINQQPYSTSFLIILSEVHDAIIHSLMQIIFDEIGKPPADFAFIVMGSEARHEQTFSTDQDNAIIIDTEDTIYFRKLGSKISFYLNEIGFAFCKGEIMASNEKWVQPLKTWQNYFSNWINNGTAQDLLDINIFFDIRTVFGNNKLSDAILSHIYNETIKNKAFISLMAKNIINQKVSFSNPVKIKELLSVFANIARVYSLYYQINEKNTLKRFYELSNLNVFSNATFKDIYHVYHFLHSLRLKYQAIEILNNKKPDNVVEINQLSEFEINSIKHSVSVIQSLQSKLIHDFKLY